MGACVGCRFDWSAMGRGWWLAGKREAQRGQRAAASGRCGEGDSTARHAPIHLQQLSHPPFSLIRSLTLAPPPSTATSLTVDRIELSLGSRAAASAALLSVPLLLLDQHAQTIWISCWQPYTHSTSASNNHTAGAGTGARRRSDRTAPLLSASLTAVCVAVPAAVALSLPVQPMVHRRRRPMSG